MRNGDHKLFAEKSLLCQVLNLRINGYATTSLALIFNCHRSSIESQLERYGIRRPQEIFTMERIASNVIFHIVPPEPRWEESDGEKISKGKSYKEYLLESQLHRTAKRI